jgi:TatD DNase family protein
MWIDSHCHLDFISINRSLEAIIRECERQEVDHIIVPSVDPSNLESVIDLSRQFKHVSFALGFHPMYIDKLKEGDLENLDNCISGNTEIIALGEIGLDFFERKDNIDQQEEIFVDQLKLARKYDLPVIMHVRGAIDRILKNLRRYSVRGGIAHAFNGSMQQASQFIELGFKLGFGGAMTYERAKHLQMLATQIPLDAIVLETDAPDIAPSWLTKGTPNTPSQLAKIGVFLAQLRNIPAEEIARITSQNCLKVLPKLNKLYT